MTTAEFIENFQYYRRGWFSGWDLIDEPPYTGDCQDFATTVLYLETGGWLGFWKAVLTFQAVFWLVDSKDTKSKFPRHIVLKYKGKYIDSTNRKWRDDIGDNRKWFPLFAPFVFIGLLLGKVI